MAGPLLEFETEMFLSLFGCDGLLVVAEGMGIDHILLQFMRVYSEQGSLVLLLNTTTPEQVHNSYKRFIAKLNVLKVTCMLWLKWTFVLLIEKTVCSVTRDVKNYSYGL